MDKITMQRMHDDLLRYGKVIKNMEYENKDGAHRVRIISRLRCLYYDHMHNGELVDCHRLEPIKE